MWTFESDLDSLTLATSQIDIVRGFMDSISYDHVNTLSLLREQGVKIETVKAMGGGSRSVWWTQLKCDMMGVPIEVISQPEPGTLGAALLAGVAIGTYNNITEASKKFAGVTRKYGPNLERAKLHQEKLEKYRHSISALLTM